MSFVHVHLHTDRSLGDGLSSPEAIAKRVFDLRQPGFFITDHGTTSGLMAGFNAVKDMNKQAEKDGIDHRIKFGFGSEFYFVRDVTIKERGYHHLSLLAKDNEGYKNLLKLTTLAHSEGNYYYKPKIDFAMLKEYHKGLICTTACMGGILKLEDDKLIQDFAQLFGSDFYIELHTNTLEGQKEYNLKALETAKKYGIQVVAACDSHYVYKEDAPVHRAWKGIGENDENAYYGTDDFYIMSATEVAKALHYLPPNVVAKAIKTSIEILDKCNVTIDMKTKHYPDFPIPEGYDTQLDYLKDICRQGWRDKVSPLLKKCKTKAQFDKLKAEYEERINHEFEVLEKAEYINYFLITWDILNWCKQNKIYTGVGRGSVTASLVAYLMGITKIDPIKYNLIFARFAHLERVTPPDKNNVERYGNIAC